MVSLFQILFNFLIQLYYVLLVVFYPNVYVVLKNIDFIVKQEVLLDQCLHLAKWSIMQINACMVL